MAQSKGRFHSITTLVPFLSAVTAVLTIVAATTVTTAQDRKGPRGGKSIPRPTDPAPGDPTPTPLPEPGTIPPVPSSDPDRPPYEWPGGEHNIIAIAWGDTDPSLEYIQTRYKVSVRDDPAAVAAYMSSVPDGRRVLHPRDMCIGLVDDPRDVCLTPSGRATNQRGLWPDRGLAEARTRFEEFFADYKAAGGDVDYVVLTYEHNYQWSVVRRGGNARLRAIEKDPRFGQIAELLGFDDLRQVDRDRDKRYRWDAVMEGWRVRYMNAAFADVVHEYFPDAAISNYKSYVLDEQWAIPDMGGRPDYRISAGFGTHDTAKLYGIIKRGLARSRLDGSHPLGDSPFAGVLLSVNHLRAIRRSSDRPFQPWVVGYSHVRSAEHRAREFSVADSAHYDDYIFQLGVHGCRELIVWNLKASTTNEPGTFASHSDDVRLNNLLREMNERLDGQWGETVTLDHVPWDSHLIASGLHVDDRIVWRLTLDDGYRGVKVKIGGQVKTVLRESHRRGMWIEHPADETLEVIQLLAQ